MTDTNEKEIINTEQSGETEALVDSSVPESGQVSPVVVDERPRDFKRRKNERRPSRRTEKPRQEFDQKILEVRRVARVTSGGRRFSFSTSVAIGDRKGRVGVGLGKSGDTPLAVEKAVRAARKNMVSISLKNSTIPHDIKSKFGASTVELLRAPGKGVVAGSAVRTVLELAGVKEVSGKILSRSKNKLNIARATVNALKSLKGKKADKIDKKIEDKKESK